MKVGAAFPSKYLKSDDVVEDTTLTIKSITIEDVGTTKVEDKPVAHFVEVEKGLVLNKTNCNSIAKAYGDEMDDWLGKRITLYATEVDFQGDQVMAIRVRLPRPGQRQTAPVAPTAAANNNGTNAGMELAAAKAAAWSAWKAKNPDLAGDALKDSFMEALKRFYPGQLPAMMGSVQFRQIVEAGFVRPPVENPISDVPEFTEEEIPF